MAMRAAPRSASRWFHVRNLGKRSADLSAYGVIPARNAFPRGASTLLFIGGQFQ